MGSGNGRRKFDKEFKREAVRQGVEGGRPVAEVARSLGIYEMLLHNTSGRGPRAHSPGRVVLSLRMRS